MAAKFNTCVYILCTIFARARTHYIYKANLSQFRHFFDKIVFPSAVRRCVCN